MNFKDLESETMRLGCKNYRHCQKIGQHLGAFLLMTLVFTTLLSSAKAQVLRREKSYDQTADILNLIDAPKQTSSRGRAPANYVPNDEVEPAPIEQKIWLQNILVEDDAGVLAGVKRDLERWRETDEYAKKWNLKSTGLYNTPSKSHRKSYLSKKLLKYVDKRLSGEIKKAEEGSTLHKIGKVEKALKPDTEVQVADNFKVRFKARVLQGKAIMILENPYVDYNTYVTAKGEVNVNVRKELKDFGLTTNVDYRVDKGSYVARIDRKLTNKLRARLSSSQSEKDVVFSGAADKKLQFMYHTNW